MVVALVVVVVVVVEDVVRVVLVDIEVGVLAVKLLVYGVVVGGKGVFTSKQVDVVVVVVVVVVDVVVVAGRETTLVFSSNQSKPRYTFALTY